MTKRKAAQARVLDSRGRLLHSFWHEDKQYGLSFVYHTVATLSQVIGDGQEIVESARYAEVEEDDSL